MQAEINRTLDTVEHPEQALRLPCKGRGRKNIYVERERVYSTNYIRIKQRKKKHAHKWKIIIYGSFRE